MSNNKSWTDKVRKHLVGQTITDVKWLSPKRHRKIFRMGYSTLRNLFIKWRCPNASIG